MGVDEAGAVLLCLSRMSEREKFLAQDTRRAIKLGGEEWVIIETQEESFDLRYPSKKKPLKFKWLEWDVDPSTFLIRYCNLFKITVPVVEFLTRIERISLEEARRYLKNFASEQAIPVIKLLPRVWEVVDEDMSTLRCGTESTGRTYTHVTVSYRVLKYTWFGFHLFADLGGSSRFAVELMSAFGPPDNYEIEG